MRGTGIDADPLLSNSYVSFGKRDDPFRKGISLGDARRLNLATDCQAFCRRAFEPDEMTKSATAPPTFTSGHSAGPITVQRGHAAVPTYGLILPAMQSVVPFR